MGKVGEEVGNKKVGEKVGLLGLNKTSEPELVGEIAKTSYLRWDLMPTTR